MHHEEGRTRVDFVYRRARQFNEAHSYAWELSGVNQKRQNDQFHLKKFVKLFKVEIKVWVISNKRLKNFLYHGRFIALSL